MTYSRKDAPYPLTNRPRTEAHRDLLAEQRLATFEPLVEAYVCLFFYLLYYIGKRGLSNVSGKGSAFNVQVNSSTLAEGRYRLEKA
jgi:hypothetical protein